MARPLGSRNKIDATAKENIVAVFTRLGGTAGMAKWARRHRSEFYRLYARLLPQQFRADVNVTMTLAELISSVSEPQRIEQSVTIDLPAITQGAQDAVAAQ